MALPIGGKWCDAIAAAAAASAVELYDH